MAKADRGRGQVLVDAGAEVDVVALQERPRLPELLVESAQRRATVAGNETTGLEAGRGVALALHDRQAHQRLGAGQKDAAGLQRVLIVEVDGGKRHRGGAPRAESVSARRRLTLGCRPGNRARACGGQYAGIAKENEFGRLDCVAWIADRARSAIPVPRIGRRRSGRAAGIAQADADDRPLSSR
jgi:hypothetical protein